MELGVEGAELGVEGRGAGVEGAGSGDRRGGESGKIRVRNSEKMAVLGL